MYFEYMKMKIVDVKMIPKNIIGVTAATLICRG
jgi:hypothetical protein